MIFYKEQFSSPYREQFYKLDIGDIIQFTCGTKLELAKIIKLNPSTVVVLLTNGKIEEIKESDIVNVIRF